MLSEKGQEIIHIQNDIAIPLNKKIKDTYVETNIGLKDVFADINSIRINRVNYRKIVFDKVNRRLFEATENYDRAFEYIESDLIKSLE
jgi:hypothetical protein